MKHYIGGELVCGNGETMEVFDPATGFVAERFPAADATQAQEALDAAAAAFPAWSKMSLRQRGEVILRFASALEAERDKIIGLLIRETGKPLAGAVYDFEMLPNCLRFFYEEALRLEGDIILDPDNSHLNLIIRKPIGVVVGYLAWNFPLLNLGYKLGPVLASGCTCVLKPSSLTSLASLYVGEVAKASGVPSGVINIISGPGETLAKAMNSSKIPKMLTLIGSSQTGRKIITQSATSIKHFSLELGGNAPAVVCKSADVESAANHICDIKFGNAGQVCVAANRVFVHKAVKDTFLRNALAFISRITLGSGDMPADILMGPMISQKAQTEMASLVKDAVEKGARVLCGGKPAEGRGFFFLPTILDGVTPDMRVYKEEIFGPVMPVLAFDDGDDIAAMANDTEYGLAAYLFTNDLNEALSISRAIDAGSVSVNAPFYACNLPHGGLKESGIGKDCSKFSLEEYYGIQRISIQNA